MTDHPDSRDKLLAEVFHDNWTDGPPAGFARRAAALARRRRQNRAGGLMAAGIAASVALLLAISHQKVSTPVTAPAPAPAYEVISDAELLEALHDRPLLIVSRDDGTRQLVLLDR